MAKKNYNITLDPEIGETLRLWAKKDDRSLSYYINEILSKYISKTKSKEQ